MQTISAIKKTMLETINMAHNRTYNSKHQTIQIQTKNTLEYNSNLIPMNVYKQIFKSQNIFNN